MNLPSVALPFLAICLLQIIPEEALSSPNKANYIIVGKVTDLRNYVANTKTDNHLLVVYFWYTDCKPCRDMVPAMMDNLAPDMKDVTLLKINSDECWNCATEFQCITFPTFFFIKDGKEVGKIAGITAGTSQKFKEIMNNNRKPSIIHE